MLKSEQAFLMRLTSFFLPLASHTSGLSCRLKQYILRCYTNLVNLQYNCNQMDGLKPVFENASLPQSPIIIAGPCSAESKEQTLESASALRNMGIKYFRAGIWKPRTKPGCFEGVGARGLPWLIEVKNKLEMELLTEIATPSHLKSALRHGIRFFWIGARTTANPFAVQAIADELKLLPAEKKEDIAFLIKNPVNPDLELWIGGIQRIYDAGIRRLGAIHRGFSSYGRHVYRNPPEWRIPLELRHRLPELTLLCDPSHIAGRRDLILPLSQHALDMNFDGLMIEVHAAPEDALSDSSQQLTPEDFSSLLHKLEVRNGTGMEDLRVYREEIDSIDNEIISLLAKRMSVSKEIGRLKQKSKISVWQSDRYNELMSRHIEESSRLGLSSDFVKKILSTIHEESVNTQINLPHD